MDATLADEAVAALDPAFGWTLRALLACLFARALAGKLREPRAFARAVDGYALLPAAAAWPLACALLALELAVVPALLVPATAPAACLAAALLLGTYTGAIAINLVRGRRDIDCGCSGPARRQTLHELLLVRNVLLMGMALAALLPAGARSLGWLDAVTVGAGGVALLALVVAVEGLAANATGARGRPAEAAG